MKTWSSTQTTIATSSGEAELYAIARAGCEGIGLRSHLADLGTDIKIVFKTDSSATCGVVRRKGAGKLRHVDVRYLWMQQAIVDKKFEVVKIDGIVNSADLMTKFTPETVTGEHCVRMNFERGLQRVHHRTTGVPDSDQSYTGCVVGLPRVQHRTTRVPERNQSYVGGFVGLSRVQHITTGVLDINQSYVGCVVGLPRVQHLSLIHI